jgi:hypothetical protein
MSVEFEIGIPVHIPGNVHQAGRISHHGWICWRTSEHRGHLKKAKVARRNRSAVNVREKLPKPEMMAHEFPQIRSSYWGSSRAQRYHRVVSSVPFQLRYLHRELHELQEGETYINTSEAKVNIERRREVKKREEKRRV